MWQQVERILAEAAQRSVESVVAFLPGVLALTMILLFALLLGALVRVVLLRALRGLEFDRLASSWGMGAFGDWTQSQGLSAFFARLTQWVILVLGLLIGLTALDAAVPAEFALSIFRVRFPRHRGAARARGRRHPRAVSLPRGVNRRGEHGDSLRARVERGGAVDR